MSKNFKKDIFLEVLKEKLEASFRWDISYGASRIRILWIGLAFLLCFSVIIYRLFSVASHNYVRILREDDSIAFRKEILDRNGKILAMNVPSGSFFANPPKVIDIEGSIKKISSVLPDIDKNKLKADLKSGKNFIWVKRDLSPSEQARLFNLGLVGFDFKNEEKRIYAFGNLFSHVIGYVGRDSEGLAGLEKSYEKFLTDDPSSVSKEEVGKPLELTLDVRLQNIVSEELDRTIEEFKAKGAAAVVVDPTSGEILAMVSKPDFDPHRPGLASKEQLFNQASLGIYEIGSVFKILTLAVGLETKSVTLNDLYDISYMKVGKFALKDYHKKQGWHSVPQIFVQSSNIGTSQIMLEISKENFKKYLRETGLTDKLNIEVPEKGTPLFPPESRWDDLTRATMSYGYAISVSPLHFVRATIPVVNGGYLKELSLVKKKNKKELAEKRIFDEKTSKDMRKLLRLVVEKGGGKRAEVNGYFVGGKTGTAHKASGGRYAEGKRISSFFGIMPASDPKYLVYVMVDEPKASEKSHGYATGSWAAAPVVGRIFERIVSLYALKPPDESSPEVRELLDVDYKVGDEV